MPGCTQKRKHCSGKFLSENDLNSSELINKLMPIFLYRLKDAQCTNADCRETVSKHGKLQVQYEQ